MTYRVDEPEDFGTDDLPCCPHCDHTVSREEDMGECAKCGKPLCENCGDSVVRRYGFDSPPETETYHVECMPGYCDPDRERDEAKDRAAERAADARNGLVEG